MATKCIKVGLEYIKKENVLSESDFISELKELQYKTYTACNRAITEYYVYDMQHIKDKEEGKEVKNDKEVYGKTFKAVVNEVIVKHVGRDISSNVTDCISQFVNKRYINDKKKGLLKGNVTLSEFKRDIPVMLRNRGYKLTQHDKGICIDIRLFSKEKQKEMGLKVGTGIKLLARKLDNSRKQILKRIMTGEYKQGTMQIVYDKRKKKFILTISYTFESQSASDLKESMILGVDLGITNIATISVFDNDKEVYQDMYWKDRVIEGKELIHYRQKLEQRRKELSIASKWASDNRIGHGYKNRMIHANNVGHKYEKFRNTYNHKVSKYIVDIALKYKCAVIQIEDLSGFSAYQSESLLKNWSYYDLQSKIKYKAEEKGIKVTMINPKYTSKRCSKCGCIHIDNRDCKNNQAKFECKVCGYTENADINASRNIAVRDIDLIIKDTEVLTADTKITTEDVTKYDFKDIESIKEVEQITLF